MVIWFYIAVVAIGAVLFNAGPELIAVFVGFVLALCIRARAAAAAREIGRASNYVTGVALRTLLETKAFIRRLTATDRAVLISALCCSVKAHQAVLGAVGLAHIWIAPRLLPHPAPFARQ